MNSLTIAKLHLRRALGNRKGLLVVVLLPILVISLIVGQFGRTSGERIPVALLNADGGWLSEQVAAAIRSGETYSLLEQDAAASDLERLKSSVYDGEWGALVYIPPGFTAKLLAGEETAVQLIRKNEKLWNVSLGLTLSETTDRLAGSIALAASAEERPGNRERLARALLERQTAGGLRVEREQLVHKADNAYVLVIGLMLLFVMILANQSIHGVVEDRDRRTMARMFAAPVRAGEIALGNFLGSFLLGSLQLVLILVVTRYVVGFDLGVPFGELVAIMECFLLAAVGLSAAAAALVKNTAMLGSINNMVVIPTCMLGGCFWPVAMMPDFMRKLANFTPQRWAIAALEQASSGASLPALGLRLGILVLFAAVLLAFGSYVLRPAAR
ncbi:ABC transporter permease [Cohnella cellulosilytica]|uniref:ABC transporter permease n=1 Tax=Cohnella cellulosilytica TaxID=986710 RepID=A0ABW2F7B7_9BACL